MNEKNTELLQRENAEHQLKKKLIEHLDQLGIEIFEIEVDTLDPLGEPREKPFVSISAHWAI